MSFVLYLDWICKWTCLHIEYILGERSRELMQFCGLFFLMTSFLSQMAKKALKSESAASSPGKEDKQPAPGPVEKPPREPTR